MSSVKTGNTGNTGNKTFNYIIFHKGCIDGFTGFFVAYNSGKLSKDVIIYEVNPSSTKIPPNIEGKDVIIIDVAYGKDILRKIFTLSKSVVFIDHHDSIKQDVEELVEELDSDAITIVYDVNRSGATLAWKFFNSRQVAPLFLKYIEDQDTGKWEFEHTRPFILALHANYHLSTESKSLNKWFRLLNKETVLEMVEEGIIINKYNQHLINVNLPRHSMHYFPSTTLYEMHKDTFDKPKQYKIALFSSRCPTVTDLAVDALKRIDCDFIIMWVYVLDKREYVFSMRSKEVDVGKICKAMGGGGHKLAASCIIKRDEIDIDDVFEGSLQRSIKTIE